MKAPNFLEVWRVGASAAERCRRAARGAGLSAHHPSCPGQSRKLVLAQAAEAPFRAPL